MIKIEKDDFMTTCDSCGSETDVKSIKIARTCDGRTSNASSAIAFCRDCRVILKELLSYNI